MDRKQSMAAHGANVTSLKFPNAHAGSAVSRRIVCAKRRLQVNHNNGPVMKKACEEVLSLEKLKKIQLSRNRLEQWCHCPFFATTITGCFVRVAVNNSSSNPLYCIGEIVSVAEKKQTYQLGSTQTNLVFTVRHAAKEQAVTLRSASNEEFEVSEFMQWRRAMMTAGMQVPTADKIAVKEQSIKEALNHSYTEKDIDYIVARKNIFRVAPLNIAKRKLECLDQRNCKRQCGDTVRVKEIEEELEKLDELSKKLERTKEKTTRVKPNIKTLPIVVSRRKVPAKVYIDEYEGLGPFVRRKTRPIMITTLKKESVRNAVYAELDLRYGCSSIAMDTTPEDSTPPPPPPALFPLNTPPTPPTTSSSLPPEHP
ncbi:RNA polymerase-associated protein RTF1 homolog [Paralichthys olivaceus]|uniref:RNA polymerase-associated protein RTF1 homolog n=1 Tax=Paralichthys olivaceus TaxID=8255 RepID=UPI003751E157